ncbi:MAG: response regulator [Lewinella sp.]|nr:response regulator [Lewinella sp.]
MKPVSILIVEDEMIIAADLALQLETVGYQVSGILPKGEDALRAVVNAPPDLVLLDISLKGPLDGIATAQQLRERYGIPFIFLTANADDATFQRAKTTRPHAFLSKPFQPPELLRAIELAISRLADNQDQLGEKLSQDHALAEPQPEVPTLLQDRIFIRHKDRMIKIALQEICYIKAERAYCKIYTNADHYLLCLPPRRL